jgi:hypothetical protein
MIGRLAFPLVLVLVLLLERMTTYLLGVIPSNPALWWLWLELRPLFRPLWLDVESLGLRSMNIQAAGILALTALFVVLAAGKRGRFWGFLGNHMALLFVASCVWVASAGQIAAVGAHPMEFGTSVALAHMSWLALLLVSTGLAGCGLCHLSYLRPMAAGKRA